MIGMSTTVFLPLRKPDVLPSLNRFCSSHSDELLRLAGLTSGRCVYFYVYTLLPHTFFTRTLLTKHVSVIFRF